MVTTNTLEVTFQRVSLYIMMWSNTSYSASKIVEVKVKTGNSKRDTVLALTSPCVDVISLLKFVWSSDQWQSEPTLFGTSRHPTRWSRYRRSHVTGDHKPWSVFFHFWVWSSIVPTILQFCLEKTRLEVETRPLRGDFPPSSPFKFRK